MYYTYIFLNFTPESFFNFLYHLMYLNYFSENSRQNSMQPTPFSNNLPEDQDMELNNVKIHSILKDFNCLSD